MNRHHSSPASILAQIAQIGSMEFGTLSEYTPAGRPKNSGPYYKLQVWQDGKNRTRYVRPEELPALREALEGYARFRALTEEYARLVADQTRSRLEAGVKKKIQPYSRHSAKKSTGSSNPS
jgi:hypothetical protein